MGTNDSYRRAARSFHGGGRQRDQASSVTAATAMTRSRSSLARIIAVISTVPHPLPRDPDGGAQRRVQVDLNLRLGPAPSAEEDGEGIACSATAACGGGGGGGGEIASGDVSAVETGPASAGEGDCYISLSPAESAAGEAKEEGENKESESYLWLLLEAARQVSGDFLDEEEVAVAAATGETKSAAAAGASGSKRQRESRPPPPVVRSRRGRSQALPLRYRDSVLEPWGKLPSAPRVARSGRRSTAR